MTRTAAMATTSSDPERISGMEPVAAKPKRKRSPNKPKPGTIVLTAEANMSQAAILDLLNTHATKMVGADVAAGMELQINVDNAWEPVGMSTSGASIRFATKGHK